MNKRTMKAYMFFFVALFLICNAYQAKDNMIEINEDNADFYLSYGHSILLIFYSDSKNVDPLFEQLNLAAEMLNELPERHLVGYVDADENRQLSIDFRIKALPSIRFVRDGIFAIYTEKNKARDYYDFVLDKSGPLGLPLVKVDDLTQLKDNNDVVYVAYVENGESPLLELYLDIGFSYNNIPFCYVIGDKLVKQFGEEMNTVVVYKKFDDPHVVSHDSTLDKLTFFIETNSYPLVIDFRSKYHSKALNVYDNLPTKVLLMAEENDALPVLLDVMRDVSKSFLGQLYVVYASPLHKRYFSTFSVYPEDYPALAIMHFDQGHFVKYRYEGEFDYDNIIKWIQQFQEDKLTPFKRSEPLPKVQDSSVYKIVGKTFNTVVNDMYKNVFVKFYDPNCIHCKDMKEKYDHVASVLVYRDDLVFGEIDMTKNEVTLAYNIIGYPTVLFFPAGDDKTPIVYEERMDTDHVGLFITNHAKHIVPPLYHENEDL
ncbi:hypothetical protein WA158_005769 [Blastocystis sp. Blastoise]